MITLAHVEEWGWNREIVAVSTRKSLRGKPRGQRYVGKQIRRFERRLRRDLVHAAGDVHTRCVIVICATEMARVAREIGVKVPRSLDHLDRWSAEEIAELKVEAAELSARLARDD